MAENLGVSLLDKYVPEDCIRDGVIWRKIQHSEGRGSHKNHLLSPVMVCILNASPKIHTKCSLCRRCYWKMVDSIRGRTLRVSDDMSSQWTHNKCMLPESWYRLHSHWPNFLHPLYILVCTCSLSPWPWRHSSHLFLLHIPVWLFYPGRSLSVIFWTPCEVLPNYQRLWGPSRSPPFTSSKYSVFTPLCWPTALSDTHTHLPSYLGDIVLWAGYGLPSRCLRDGHRLEITEIVSSLRVHSFSVASPLHD